MANCVKIDKCPFFHDKMSAMPVTAEIFKRRFCEGDNTNCARWVVSQALGSAPADLYPNQLDVALKLVGKQS